MANITPILGTDSLSSSRIVLNNNFDALNTELTSVTALLNTTSQTLSLTGAISASAITLNNTSIDTFKVDSTQINASLETNLNARVNVKEGVTYSTDGTVASPVMTLPLANDYDRVNYLLGAISGTPGAAIINVNAADEGQEITLIATSTEDVILDPTNINGVTGVTIPENGTLTMRYIGSFWYIISQFNCTITL